MSLLIYISNPTDKDPIIEKYGDKYYIQTLEEVILSTKTSEWGWSYGERLFDYEGIDQIAWIIERLRKKPEAKSATITCLNPEVDIRRNKGKHIPCLTLLDFKIRGRNLLLTSVFRSQDIGKKFYGDALALFKLGEKVRKELNCEKVEIFFFIVSAHIYEEDFEKIEKILKDVENEL